MTDLEDLPSGTDSMRKFEAECHDITRFLRLDRIPNYIGVRSEDGNDLPSLRDLIGCWCIITCAYNFSVTRQKLASGGCERRMQLTTAREVMDVD